MYAPAARTGGKAPAAAAPALERPHGREARRSKRGMNDNGFGTSAGSSRAGNAARVTAAWKRLEAGGNMNEFIIGVEGQGAGDLSTWLLGSHHTLYTDNEDPTTASTLLRLALPSIRRFSIHLVDPHSRHSEMS